jgi:hypothetical protein
MNFIELSGQRLNRDPPRLERDYLLLRPAEQNGERLPFSPTLSPKQSQ